MEEIKIIEQAEFDAIKTLLIIEQDADLTAILKDEVTLDFNTLRSVADKGLLTPETTDFLNRIFEKIILCKKEHLAKYLKLTESASVKASIPVIKEAEPKTKKESTKKVVLPKWYGKEKILEDIEKQGGKPTSLQNAMLSVNKLKNIYANLSARGIKDMVGGTKILTDEDCRDIIATISTVEKKLEEILKRKK